MNSVILVTGGTGTLGREVVRRLLEDEHEVRVLSRRGRDEGGGGGAARAGSYTHLTSVGRALLPVPTKRVSLTTSLARLRAGLVRDGRPASSSTSPFAGRVGCG
ncbi:NAD-dependent epimerase/dehydratase family protein [Streptomyces specialis]|uniref:NAD-dependent epimerase/dehydratase family protein n=1 Tax=Streptomyces specialis TaxID=498367 RepID=UPI00099F31D7